MNGKDAPEIDRMAVKISHLDRLLGLTGEIIITASNISILQRHLQGMSYSLDKDSMEMVKNAAMTANRISSDLHHLVMDIRLIPVKETFLRFRRLVRDLAKKKGLQVNFEIVGEDTLVDKTVAERLYEPLAHQIRNALDHGLEDSIERKHQGKNPVGQLTLSAYPKEGHTFIRVEDDGRGVDEEKVKQVAREKGLYSAAAAANLTSEECFNLIMQPGFSTSPKATEISGRGVGMDVVKTMTDELGGEVIIESEPGKGASFLYKIPILSAVNITDALIIRAGREHFAVPIVNVVATQAFQVEELHTTMERSRSIIYLGSIIPLHDLHGLLYGGEQEEDQETIPVIIIEAKNGRIALKVSEFIRPQKLVLIPLPDLFDVNGVSGTTILGGNQLGLVLDPFELVNLATGESRDSAEEGFLSRESIEFDQDLFTGVETVTKDAETEVLVDESAESEDKDIVRVAGMDASLAGDFFLEIKNILTELNEEIFQLEKDPDSPERINTIFRHFHSIKGNLIMTGFEGLGAMVHDVETVLGRMRERDLEVNQELIDLLLDSVKLLEEAISHIRAGRHFKLKDDELMEALNKFKPRAKAEEDEAEGEEEAAFVLSSFSSLLLQAKTDQGANIFQSRLRFNPTFQQPFLVAYLILRRLALLGDVIATTPTLEKIEKGMVSDTVKVMFATSKTQEEVDRFARNQLTKYYEVIDFDNLLME